MRVAVFACRLPYVRLNRASNLVGFDIERAQLLGRDLGVRVELVELDDPAALPSLLRNGRVDLSTAGIAVAPERAGEFKRRDGRMDAL